MSNARELAQIPSTPSGRRNLIINGAMNVAQRGTSNSSVSDGAFVIDRYSLRTSNNGWYAAEQSSDAPVGFSYSLKITSNGANTPASGAYIFFTQKIEGFNSAQLEFGTANAKTITISFYIKSSLTGTFAGSIRNSAQNRSYPYTFTISSANTWEYKTVTVAGDTTGTWVGSTNGIGLDMIFNLGSGSSNSGTAGAWASAGHLSATGSVNLVETSGATLFMTGLQVEVGSVATEFEHRSFGEELALCQRYFQDVTLGSTDAYAMIASGGYESSTVVRAVLHFTQAMRTLPSVTSSGSFQASPISQTLGSLTLDRVSELRGDLSFSTTDARSGGYSVNIRKKNDANAYIYLDAEL